MKRPNKMKMPRQDPKIRIKNFNEVALGYTAEQAIEEASRCFGCKKPKCRNDGCPVGVNIPDFIKHISKGDFRESYRVLSDALLFPRITGRVCPQESQCEGSCICGIKDGSDPVAIGNLERFIGDWAAEKRIMPSYDIQENGKSVAIVGSGPSGITAAADLRKMGYDVTLYEALHVLGGVLVYGIPAFRLPKDIVRNEILKLEKMGVKIQYNTLIGSTISFEDLKNVNDAVFIGIGAGLPRFMNIPGEDLVGVYTANEFLVRINLMGANKFPQYSTPIEVGDKVAVVGGGNVAMDCARVSLRLGADVDLYYRRTREYMPARKAEIHHALEEGVNFKELNNPIELLGKNGILQKVKYSINVLSDELDRSGRQIPVETGQIATSDYDTFIIAIGQNPNPLLPKRTKCLDIDRRGYIIVDPKTLKVKSVSDCPVFAGGDIIGNQHRGRGGTVIDAMGHGRTAANYIDQLLKKTKSRKKTLIISEQP
ncbi:MAG: NADPH-dependent glutamate synthase [Candidatus Lokiarchaeota archaeon]|nr:NADPH-dependent glutamate synthase [Candidatus Lokiarchaeota archaeon]